MTLLMSSCGYNFGENYFITEQIVQGFKPVSELQASITNKPVDVLFVIDNSGSMDPAQDALAAEVNSFANEYLTTSADLCVNSIGSNAYRYRDPNNSDNSLWAPGVNITNQGSPILQKRMCTKNADGSPANINQLKADFTDAMRVGIGGSGNEMLGLSALAFTEFNEKDPTKPVHLWRSNIGAAENHVRFIVFVTDEDHQDHSINNTTNRPVTTATGPDQYTTNATSCMRSFLTYNFTLDRCIQPAIQKMTAENFIENQRNFFASLDGTTNTPNYDPGLNVITVSIQNLQTLYSLRKTGVYGNNPNPNAPDTETYYAHNSELVRLPTLLGGASGLVDIGSPNYSLVFQIIGNSLSVTVSFELEHVVDLELPIVAKIRYIDGTEVVVDPSYYSVTNGMDNSIFEFNALGTAFAQTLPPTSILLLSYTPVNLL